MGSIRNQCDQIIKKQNDLDKEKQEQELRARNIVIFGIEETPDIDETVEKLNKVIKDECHMQVSLNKTTVQNHRLGQKSGKNRPVKVQLSDEKEKWEMLKRLNGLNLRGVFGRLDMNRDERKQDFALRQELKKTREGDPSHLYKAKNKKIFKIGPK